MERIHYAGDTVLTGTEISEALLEYARALGANDQSDTIEIPAIDDEGNRVTSRFLIGPASQLVADSEVTEFEELVDVELVTELRRRTAALNRPHVRAETVTDSNMSGLDDL